MRPIYSPSVAQTTDFVFGKLRGERQSHWHQRSALDTFALVFVHLTIHGFQISLNGVTKTRIYDIVDRNLGRILEILDKIERHTLETVHGAVTVVFLF